MTSPALEIAAYLEAEGVGVYGGNGDWSIHVGRSPLAPNNVVVLFDTGGPAAILEDIAFREPTFQVLVRGDDYAASRAVLEEIDRILVQPFNAVERTIGESFYVGIWVTSDMIDLGRDENDRFRMSANYRAQRQPVEES